MPDVSEYVDLAADRVVELLDEHHALVHPELEARVAEAGFLGSDLNIDPHHLTTALRQLTAESVIEGVTASTRGGQPVTTVQLVDTRKRSTRIAKAAARKRLLYARYNSWAQGSTRHPNGLIGPAGEAAVRVALLRASTLSPAQPLFGETRQLLGVTLNGPADSGGYLIDFDKQGTPGAVTAVLIEVKNTRSWIYPSSAELWQLLQKALHLQTQRPNQAVLPMLICRRAHPTTFWMASQLGFFVIDMQIQYAGDVNAAALDEVRNELFLSDLRPGVAPPIRVQDRVRDTLPHNGLRLAAKWATAATEPDLAAAVLRVYKHRHSNRDRLQALDHLRALLQARGQRVPW